VHGQSSMYIVSPGKTIKYNDSRDPV